jgi:hypothetical protein
MATDLDGVRASRVRSWMVVAAIAAGLTFALPLLPARWVESTPFALIGVPLGFGLIVASLPFGGLHNAPPFLPLAILSSILNAAIWGGVFWLQSRRKHG